MNEIILNGTGHGVPSLVDSRGEPEGGLPKLIKVNGITTNAHIPAEISLEQIKQNIKRGYPRLHQLPEFDQIRSKDDIIVLVGGGPSLKDKNLINDIVKFQHDGCPIIACGSTYDFLVESGIIPDYCAICDPEDVAASYITKANRKTLFLLSSALHPSVYDKLIGYNIVIWHCHSEANEEALKELEVNYQAIGGGCTIGLRSLSIAIMLGYINIHFFGFDSCLSSDDSHHAYDFIDSTKEFLGDVYRIRIGFGIPGDKTYRVVGYQLAQAEHFKNFYNTYGMYFTPTFHGPGLLADMFETILEKSKTTGKKMDESIQTVGVVL